MLQQEVIPETKWARIELRHCIGNNIGALVGYKE